MYKDHAQLALTVKKSKLVVTAINQSDYFVDRRGVRNPTLHTWNRGKSGP